MLKQSVYIRTCLSKNIFKWNKYIEKPLRSGSNLTIYSEFSELDKPR